MVRLVARVTGVELPLTSVHKSRINNKKGVVMNYEETPVKKSKVSSTSVALKGLERVGTLAIVWYLIKRHKFAIAIVWAVTITLLYTMPFLPSLILG